MLLYLIRHAKTIMNEWNIMNWQAQDPLSDAGMIQAQKLAEKFAKIPLDALRTSDLSRTIDTAKHIADVQDNLISKPDPRLRERDVWELEWVSLEKLRELAAAHGMKRSHFSEVDERVEKSADIVKRFYARYDEQIASSDHKAVWVVTHGALIRILLAHLIGIPTADYLDTHTWIENTGVSIISIKDWHRRIVTINDFSHLL